jgi:hypothetical protein
MNTIPIDIIREHILPYIYEPQSRELCDDIKSFYKCKFYLRNLYYERWKFSFYYEPDADINWLDNDLTRFLNNDCATMLGFTNNCIQKFSRIFGLKGKNRKTISNYIDKHTGCETKALNSINIQIGILTPKERQDFISFSHSLI